MDGFSSLVPSRRRFSRRAALLFGIALSILCLGIGCGDFTLFGDDDDNGSQGPCDGDPCDSIDDAKAGTCTADGDSDFTCDCDAGFLWDGDTDTCQDDPCDPDDPCNSIDNAVHDSCEAQGFDAFTCVCEDGFEWDDASDTCQALPFQLSSSAFSDGGQIPSKHAHTDCDGDNVSPPLAWENIPEDTQSFALFMVESDSAPVFVNWVVLNIPSSVSEIVEGTVPQGATQLQNGFGTVGYGGPCPPREEEREYEFTMMALSVAEIDATSYEDALAAAGAAAVATASLVGRYSRLPDPCEGDPCDDLDDAIRETCEAVGSDDFTCQCDTGFTWNAQSNECESEAVGTCEDLETCFLTCNGFEDFGCQSSCYATWTGCECELDFNGLVTSCGLICFADCPITNPFTKSCWDCVVPCGFDTQCQ